MDEACLDVCVCADGEGDSDGVEGACLAGRRVDWCGTSSRTAVLRVYERHKRGPLFFGDTTVVLTQTR